VFLAGKKNADPVHLARAMWRASTLTPSHLQTGEIRVKIFGIFSR
jgi:hypothetical protein